MVGQELNMIEVESAYLICGYEDTTVVQHLNMSKTDTKQEDV